MAFEGGAAEGRFDILPAGVPWHAQHSPRVCVRQVAALTHAVPVLAVCERVLPPAAATSCRRRRSYLPPGAMHTLRRLLVKVALLLLWEWLCSGVRSAANLDWGESGPTLFE